MIRTLALTTALLAATASHAGQLLTNGDFEAGDYTGWSVNVQAASNGNLNVVANNGGTSPISGFAYQMNAAGGNFFSITDQLGPGSYSLTQRFTLATAQTVQISFDMFANDQAGTVAANGRDYMTFPNQNAVVDLLVGGADPFTNAAGDIVGTFFGPGADDLNGNPNPWMSYSASVRLAAGTYQLRFAETDNQGFFQQGVDNASVLSAAPEPASWALLVVGFGLAGSALRRRRVVAA